MEVKLGDGCSRLPCDGPGGAIFGSGWVGSRIGSGDGFTFVGSGRCGSGSLGLGGLGFDTKGLTIFDAGEIEENQSVRDMS